MTLTWLGYYWTSPRLAAGANHTTWGQWECIIHSASAYTVPGAGGIYYVWLDPDVNTNYAHDCKCVVFRPVSGNTFDIVGEYDFSIASGGTAVAFTFSGTPIYCQSGDMVGFAFKAQTSGKNFVPEIGYFDKPEYYKTGIATWPGVGGSITFSKQTPGGYWRLAMRHDDTLLPPSTGEDAILGSAGPGLL